MWEMQVLSSQRNNGKNGDDIIGGASSSGTDFAGEDRLSAGDNTDIGLDSPQEEHPALRGVEQDSPSPSNDVILNNKSTNNENNQPPSPTNGTTNNVGAIAGRKRPLLPAGGPRTSMTPTKRTVMSLLARARAAQAKHVPTTYPRTVPERSSTLVPLLREDYITGAVNLNLI